MRPLVPEFIYEQLAAADPDVTYLHGRFSAAVLLIDTSSSAILTAELMQYGKAGAESLADILRAVFAPLVDAVYAQGGFVANFSGDGFTALFPSVGPLANAGGRALAAAWAIRAHLAANPVQETPYGRFPFAMKASAAACDIDWQIWRRGADGRSTVQTAAFAFTGDGIVNCMHGERLAASGDVVASDAFLEALPDHLIVHSASLPGAAGFRRVIDLDGPLPSPEDDAIETAVPPAPFFRLAQFNLAAPGEFRHVVSLFLQPQTDPDDAFMAVFFRLLDQYDGYLCRAEAHDGGGPRFLLFWGAPAGHENDLARALYFLRALVRETAVPVRAGLTYDLAFAGFVGSAARQEYTCYGSRVNLAARLMDAAGWGDLWLDETVAERAGDNFELAPTGRRRFKGFDAGLPVWSLLGRKVAAPHYYRGRLIGRRRPFRRADPRTPRVGYDRFWIVFAVSFLCFEKCPIRSGGTMKRRLIVTSLALFALSIPLFVSQFGRWQAAHAQSAPEDARGGWGNPHVGIVVDTTATMGQPLNAIAAAWQAQSSNRPLPGTYHLAAFKDEAQYFGNTANPVTFYNWLDALEAGGGGNCPDNALAGLVNLGSNMPSSITPPSEVLLATDATPIGKRTAYAYVANRLLERGIQVYTLSNGWCLNAPLTEDALVFLSVASGGEFLLTDGPNYYTDTLITLNKIAAADRLGIFEGAVTPGNPQIFDFDVDSTMTTLGVEDDDYPTWCLTCTRGLPGQFAPVLSAPEAFNVVIRDPGGNVMGPGSDGYEVLVNDYRQLQSLFPEGELMTGTWEVEVSGDGDFWIDFYADSSLHLVYPGRHTLPAGRPVPFRAALVDEVNGPSNIAAADFYLMSMDGTQTQDIQLFDDGQHGDGAAGDGVYGGPVLRDAQGCWMLMVQGTLSDGSPFQRMYPAPIRFRGFDLNDPTPTSVVPGTTRIVNFTLENGEPLRGGETTTFDLEVFSDQGWAITDTIPLSVTLQPGESIEIQVPVEVPTGTLAGAIDDVVLVAAPTTDIGLATSATVEVSVIEAFELFLPVALRP